ncbi:MAG: acyl-CoA dehydrogenase family protein [Ilumatobacteraceae bacterium]
MDFWLSDDERDLQDGIRSFLRGRFPIDVVRAREEQPDGVIDPDRWRELADTGVFTIANDMGMRAATLVFEELGRSLVAGPLVATALTSQWVAGAGTGDVIVASLETDERPVLVDHPDQAHQFLALTDDGVVLVAAADVQRRTVPMPLDTLTPVAVVDLPVPSGTVVAGPAEAARVRRDAVLLTAALQLGVALGATELSQQYAIEREQFGRPIGSFQAVKHLLADMLTKAEVARSAVYAAACAVDGASDDDPVRAASVAKVMAGEAALFCGKSGIQVHGGMGFTWEVHAQRYWKRAVALDNSYGIIDHHAAVLAATL